MAAPRKRTAAKAAELTKEKASSSVKREVVPKCEMQSKTVTKTEVKASVFVQYLGKEISAEALVEAAKAAFVSAGHTKDEIKTIDVYVKPEENTAYYAVNGEGSEEYKIQL